MTMVDTRHYLEGCEPVAVLRQWRPAKWSDPATWACARCGTFASGVFGGHSVAVECRCGARTDVRPLRGGPRNVLIRRGDGSTVVRPARGLTPVRPVGTPDEPAGPGTGTDAGARTPSIRRPS